MALTTGELTWIYSVLVIIAIVISITLMLSLTLSPKVFIAIFSLYMCGCTTYLFAYLIMKKSDLNKGGVNDIKYTVADYMTLFNMILCLFVFIMCFVIPMVHKKENPLSLPMYGFRA